MCWTQRCIMLAAVLGGLGLSSGLALAQQAVPSKDYVAVLDLSPVGAEKAQAVAVTDRLREELMASGKFHLVSRDQIDKVLEEQAKQQQACTSGDCSAKVGKLLGVRKIISGRLTKLDDNLWMMAVSLVDVETAQTERASSVTYDGKFVALLTDGVRQLIPKLTGK